MTHYLVIGKERFLEIETTEREVHGTWINLVRYSTFLLERVINWQVAVNRVSSLMELRGHYHEAPPHRDLGTPADFVAKALRGFCKVEPDFTYGSD